MALQSIRLCAAAEMVSHKRKGRNRRGRRMRLSLLVAQGLHGIKARSAARGIQTGQQAHHDREGNRTKHQPPGYKPNLFRREMLAFQINVRAYIDDPPNGPPQRDPRESAEYTHYASFCEEQ